MQSTFEHQRKGRGANSWEDLCMWIPAYICLATVGNGMLDKMELKDLAGLLLYS